MHIRRAHISNFKSIDDLTIDFDSTITALIGRNAAGKSNVLQAIESILGAFGSSGGAAWRDLHRRTVRGFNEAARTDVTLDVELPETVQRQAFDPKLVQVIAANGILVRLYLGIDQSARQMKFGFAASAHEHLFDVSPNSKFSSGIDDFLQRLELEPLGGLDFKLAPIQEYLYPSTLLLASRVSTGQGTVVGARSLAEDASNLVQFLITLLSSNARAYGEVMDALTRLVPEAARVTTPLIEGTNSVEIDVRDVAFVEQPIPWDSVSTGTKQILHLLGYALSTPVMLLEEPELSLHASVTVELIRVLEHIAKQRGTQLICTTHSPALIDALSFEQVRILSRDTAGGTRAHSMVDFAGVERELRKFGVLLDHCSRTRATSDRAVRRGSYS